MKILSIFGTRPEAIKMAPVVKALKQHFGEDAKICVTGQHRSMLDHVLNLFNIIPDYDLDIMRQSQDLTEITCGVLNKLKNILKQLQPKRILVHGDTSTTLAAALAAYYQKIPVAHIEAGLRSNNIYSPWPEEINRRVVANIADIHFAPTPQTANNLIAEGVANESIVVTGNTVIDALLYARQILHSDANLLISMFNQFNYLDSAKKLILVTGHRRENMGDKFQQICQALLQLAQRTDVEIVYPVHLNPEIRHTVHCTLSENKNIHLIEPLEYLAFIYLMEKSYLILTDSGGIQEEATVLGVPVLILRDNTERSETVFAGTAKLIGTNKDMIVSTVEKLIEEPSSYHKMHVVHNAYGDGKATQRILSKLIELHTHVTPTYMNL